MLLYGAYNCAMITLVREVFSLSFILLYYAKITTTL